jgi:uncharacterized membrane protein
MDAESSESLKKAKLIYILLFLSPFTIVTGIVGVVMAYMSRDKSSDWLQTHYENQINIFWKGALYLLISYALCFVLIGLLLVPISFLWIWFRAAIGFRALLDDEYIDDPKSWLSNSGVKRT